MQTDRQSVSECTVPETSSSYFWNTHKLVSQHYKSTLRMRLNYFSRQREKISLRNQFLSAVTMIHNKKLQPQTSLCLACFGRKWQYSVWMHVSKKITEPPQTHHLNSDIIEDVFTFLFHKILICLWRAGIFSAFSNINAEFEWLTQEEALILSPLRPSNGPQWGEGFISPALRAPD